MITWGISANSHDAALAVFDNENLIFASHSERFSGIKNDPHLNESLIKYATQWGKPREVVWYERPFVKSLRQLRAGQGLNFKKNNIKDYLKKYNISTSIDYRWHHESHAAAGYFTSTFKESCVVVIDAIGEFETLTIWHAKDNKLNKVYSQWYPDSLGLWYSAMTQRCYLKPNEEEYILMGMSAYGDPYKLMSRIENDFFVSDNKKLVKLKRNLHRGCQEWAPDLTVNDTFDIAAATQKLYEYHFTKILVKARELVNCDNLVLMGGCALNCLANPISYNHFKNVWIMPNPGDAGSAIGAVLANRSSHISFTDCYLGYKINPQHSTDEIVDYLYGNQMCGVAQGRAEFGPRALGNRSLLADPRGPTIKDRVNEIKRRQQFRPFAPVILEELADQHFDLPGPSSDNRYMQFISTCKHPDLFPAIVHRDLTSRVQTVPKNGSRIRTILEKWYQLTGCPMLLNTSLNIKGYPIVNNIKDAKDFETTYNLKVFT